MFALAVAIVRRRLVAAVDAGRRRQVRRFVQRGGHVRIIGVARLDGRARLLVDTQVGVDRGVVGSGRATTGDRGRRVLVDRRGWRRGHMLHAPHALAAGASRSLTTTTTGAATTGATTATA